MNGWCMQDCSVLIVEDNPISQMITVAMLRSLGVVGDVVTGLGEARKALESEDYRAILMDSQLPDGDGLDFTRDYIKAGGAVPVIAMVGAPEPSKCQACLEVGMVAYLEKPFTLKQLEETLQVHTAVDAK